MPRAYGRDRLRIKADETIEIYSPFSKGWAGATEKTEIRNRRARTAINWDDTLYEVISVVDKPDGSAVYTLGLFREDDVVRGTEPYDALTEADRVVRHEQRKRYEGMRRLLTWSAPITGLLPQATQELLTTEIGTPPTRLALISVFTCIAYGGWTIYWGVGAMTGLADHPVPQPPLPFLAFYLLGEAMLRLGLIFLQQRPMGSALGYLLFGFWYLFGGKKLIEGNQRARLEMRRKLAPPDRFVKAHVAAALTRLDKSNAGGEPPKKLVREAPPPEVEAADIYRVREPFVAFLPERDQLLLEWRLGFEPIKWGWRTAVAILPLAIAGTVSSINKLLTAGTFTAFLSLFTAGVLVIEQFYRMVRLSKGSPAPSLLGFFIRPFVEKVFTISPTVLSTPNLTRDEAMELAKERAMANLPEVWEGEDPE